MTKAIFTVSQQSMIHLASGGGMVAALERRERGHGTQCAIVSPSGDPVSGQGGVALPVGNLLFSIDREFADDFDRGIDRIGIDLIADLITNLIADGDGVDAQQGWLPGYQLDDKSHKQRSGRYSNERMVPTQN